MTVAATNQPEAVVPSAGGDEPRQRPGGGKRDQREDPCLAHRHAPAGQRPPRLVHRVDLEVVDLVQAVRRGVQHRGHQRAEQRVDDEPPAPRFARGGADGRRAARRHAERRREQRERPGELEVGAAARLVTRATIHAMATAAAAAVPVLMKFSMSLSRMPAGFERRAERAFHERPDRGADRREPEAVSLDRGRARAPSAESPRAATRPAAVPSSETAPDVPGRTGLKVGKRNVRRAPRLADLAGHRVARARRQRRDHHEQRALAVGRERGDDRGERRQAGVGDGVARPAAAASLLGDSEHGLPLQPEPRARRRRERRTTRRAAPSARAGEGEDQDSRSRPPSRPPAYVTVLACHPSACRRAR